MKGKESSLDVRRNESNPKLKTFAQAYGQSFLDIHCHSSIDRLPVHVWRQNQSCLRIRHHWGSSIYRSLKMTQKSGLGFFLGVHSFH
jgi:hypothetical protein